MPDLEAERAAVLRADKEWLKAFTERDVERGLSFWADDALVFPPHAPVLRGKEAIRAFVAQGFSKPGFSIRWETSRVEVASSGDLAYGVGVSEIAVLGPEGKPIVERAKGITIWKKQPNGAWKCVVDIWNAAEPGPIGAPRA